jgi:outer membrane immunogenic protein
MVLGVEADYMFGAIDGSTASGVVPAPSGNFGCNFTGCQINYDGMGTVRARLGYAIGNLLPFVTGGIAITDIEAVQAVTNSTVLYSAVVGGGLEYAFNEQLSVKAEYLHVFENDELVDTFACSVNGCHATDFSLDIVRVGLNYHF